MLLSITTYHWTPLPETTIYVWNEEERDIDAVHSRIAYWEEIEELVFFAMDLLHGNFHIIYDQHEEELNYRLMDIGGEIRYKLEMAEKAERLAARKARRAARKETKAA